MHFLQWPVSSAVSSYVSSNISSIVLLLFFVRYIVNLNKNKRLPKGPCGLPLIGYLPFLGKNPHYTLFKLSEKWGNIYTLPLGEKNIVILNDWDSVKDSLRKDAFLGRPDEGPFSLITGVKSLVDDNNTSWRENRRVFENIFKSCFDSSFICKNLVLELKALLIFLRQSKQSPVNLRDSFSKYVRKYFYSFIFGKQFLVAHSIFDASFFVNISILSLYPSWFGKIAYKIFDIFNHYRIYINFIKIFRSESKNHYKTIGSESSIRDLIDGYILELKAKKSNSMLTTMSIEKLRANCQVFLSFGSEAFLSSLEWSLITIAYFPNFQKAISHEIEQVIGDQRFPDFSDQFRMPFTVAFLNEVLRWKTVLPFNFIRRTIEDATILGNFIPKGTLVLCNIWSVHHDPLIWENPFQFNPHRFLSDDAKTLIDHEGFMPFSLGKRSCVAEPFVRKLLFIYIVSVLQKFAISTLNGEEVFDEEFNITIRPKGNVNLVFHLKKQSPPSDDPLKSTPE